MSIHVPQLLAKRLPRVEGADLLEAWGAILKRAAMNKHHRIGRQELSVREHMSRILRRLQEAARAGAARLLFAELFDPEAGRSALVVAFLALLELVRERLVDIVQNEPFAPIHAQLAILERHAEA